MGSFSKWCEEVEDKVGDHLLVLLNTDESRKVIGVEEAVKAIPQQYVSTKRYARILKRLGKRAAAQYLRTKLPKTKKGRSGELGEVLALSFVEQETVWCESVKKLRWKDHREMPMRGDDVLALGIDDGEVLLLKGEAKSRRQLSNTVLKAAAKALRKNDGLPSPHALAFYADRLAEDGRHKLADLIDDMQYRDGTRKKNVSHMIFAFSGNDPAKLLRKRLAHYKGRFDQMYVGLHVKGHGKFVESVFKKVGRDGDA